MARPCYVEYFYWAFLVLAVRIYKSHRLVSFGILWFFLALSVESSVIPIGHVIAEYRVYLASVGFVFVVTSLIYMREANQKRLNLIAVVILIGFSILTYQRNKIWKDDLSLWNNAVLMSPNKARPYISRGIAYGERGDFDLALADLNKGIEMAPRYSVPYSVRGYVYEKQGKFMKALVEYTKVIIIDPANPMAYFRRGMVFKEMGDYGHAIADFSKIIELAPHDAGAYTGRGIVFSEQGNFKAAIADFDKAIEIDPDYSEAYNRRSMVLKHAK